MLLMQQDSAMDQTEIPSLIDGQQSEKNRELQKAQGIEQVKQYTYLIPRSFGFFKNLTIDIGAQETAQLVKWYCGFDPQDPPKKVDAVSVLVTPVTERWSQVAALDSLARQDGLSSEPQDIAKAQMDTT